MLAANTLRKIAAQVRAFFSPLQKNMGAHDFFIMAIPAVIALLGGVLAAFWSPSHQARSMIQHFAAGVILAALIAAALLYLLTDELLVEAHEVEEKPISTLVLFAGFLAFWAIQLLGV